MTVSTDDPLLGPLQNNGGPTLTHAPATNSPAINQGINPLSLTTDQRGATYAREAGTAADIGAFEMQGATPPALLGDYNSNHFVDAADYVIWRKTLGTGVPQYSGADGSGNSTIDAADLTVWRQNFGNTPNQSAGTSLTMTATVSQSTVGGAANVSIAAVDAGNSTSGTSSRITKVRLAAGHTAAASPRELALLNLTDDNCRLPEPRDTFSAGEPSQVVIGVQQEAFEAAIDQSWADWPNNIDLF